MTKCGKAAERHIFRPVESSEVLRMFHAIGPVVLRIDVLGYLASLRFVFLLLGRSFLNQRIIKQVHLLRLISCSALRFLHRMSLSLTLNVVDTVRVADSLLWEEPFIAIACIDLYRVFPDLIPCFLKLTLGDWCSHLHISDCVVADAPTLFLYHCLIPWNAELR